MRISPISCKVSLRFCSNFNLAHRGDSVTTCNVCEQTEWKAMKAADSSQSTRSTSQADNEPPAVWGLRLSFPPPTSSHRSHFETKLKTMANVMRVYVPWIPRGSFLVPEKTQQLSGRAAAPCPAPASSHTALPGFIRCCPICYWYSPYLYGALLSNSTSTEDIEISISRMLLTFSCYKYWRHFIQTI